MLFKTEKLAQMHISKHDKGGEEDEIKFRED